MSESKSSIYTEEEEFDRKLKSLRGEIAAAIENSPGDMDYMRKIYDQEKIGRPNFDLTLEDVIRREAAREAVIRLQYPEQNGAHYGVHRIVAFVDYARDPFGRLGETHTFIEGTEAKVRGIMAAHGDRMKGSVEGNDYFVVPELDTKGNLLSGSWMVLVHDSTKPEV